MINDPIVASVRKDRKAYAARFNFKIHAIFSDLRARSKLRLEKTIPPASIPSPRKKAASS